MSKLTCPTCKKAEFRLGETSLNLKRGQFAAEIKGIPAQICNNCGEVFIPGSVAEPISELAETTFSRVERVKKTLQPV